MSIGYGPKWPFYSCYGLYWIDGIYVVRINAGAQEVIFTLYSCIRDPVWSLMLIGTGYVLRVELTVQRRLCPIFVKDVGSPDIHECFRGLTGSQRTPRIWGVTVLLC